MAPGGVGGRGGTVLVLGATGAVGKALVRALAVCRPHAVGGVEDVVVAACHRTTLPAHLATLPGVVEERGVSLLDQGSLDRLLARHAPSIRAIWNLAAPLSVATAADPVAARDVTEGGMRRLVLAMTRAGLSPATRLCFSDSIASFGATSPRRDASARWLVENPEQDPGSEYGRQKRVCRDILAATPFDTRWAVLPGVLHTYPVWGGGTAKYALEACRAAVRGEPYICPVRPNDSMPMIHVDDLAAGLVALMNAPPGQLQEPTAGYAIGGFHFSPAQLFGAISTVALWPDSLEGTSAWRDLGYRPRWGLLETTRAILRAHQGHQDDAVTGVSGPAATRPLE